MFEFFSRRKHFNVRAADVALFNDKGQHLGTIPISGSIMDGRVTEAFSIAQEVINASRTSGYFLVDGDFIIANQVARAEVDNLRDYFVDNLNMPVPTANKIAFSGTAIPAY